MNTGNNYNLFNTPPPNFKGQLQPWSSKPATINSSNYNIKDTCKRTSNNHPSGNSSFSKYTPQYARHVPVSPLQMYGTTEAHYSNVALNQSFPLNPIDYCTPPPYPPPAIAYQGTYATSAGGIYRPLNNFCYKRQNNSGPEHQIKNAKKRKKPLSQNIPSRKDWSVEDAKRALEVEKEFNKRHKRPSLIIKFPDLELNREIVSKFHSAIDSVHFQQPSTPRYCFVTLRDDINEEDVIRSLNNIKFGGGYLTVEHKKDKEDEINIGPEDIDPFTLYVGNLVQEVTKEDIVRAYPKQRRIDIGFAKKMKYTRYAFVCFRTVADAIEAFQNTYATEMYSKSLIVRFRRLHGTHGMSGEPKPSYTAKRKETEDINVKQAETDSTVYPFKATPIKQESYTWLGTNTQQTTENVLRVKQEYNGYGESSCSSGSDEEDEPLPDCFRNYIGNTDSRSSVFREYNDLYNLVHCIKKEPEDNDLQKTKPTIELESRSIEVKKEVILETDSRLHMPMLEIKSERNPPEVLPSMKYHFPIQLPIKQEDVKNSKTYNDEKNKNVKYHLPIEVSVKLEEQT